jgi:hypothetical protein
MLKSIFFPQEMYKEKIYLIFRHCSAYHPGIYNTARIKMFRLLFTALLLGSWVPCPSKEVPQIADVMDLHQESLALIYIGSGHANLFAHKHGPALRDFQKALSLVNHTDGRYPELEALSFFGQAIAYDNLGAKSQCQNALASLFFSLNESGNEEEGCESRASDSRLTREYEEADDIMRRLASLAASTEIRELLLSLVDEMSKELLSPLKIAAQTHLDPYDWQYDHGDTARASLCKSRFLKTIEKAARKVYSAVVKAKMVLDFMKEIEQTMK